MATPHDTDVGIYRKCVVRYYFICNKFFFSCKAS